MGAICVENSSNEAVRRRTDVIFLQRLFTEEALDDTCARRCSLGHARSRNLSAVVDLETVHFRAAWFAMVRVTGILMMR